MQEAADCFKALGEVTRLKILTMLAEGERCACDVQVFFDLKQPTISHHMKILQQSGLVEVDKRGKWMFYTLNKEKFQELKDFLDIHMVQKPGQFFEWSEQTCDGMRSEEGMGCGCDDCQP